MKYFCYYNKKHPLGTNVVVLILIYHFNVYVRLKQQPTVYILLLKNKSQMWRNDTIVETVYRGGMSDTSSLGHVRLGCSLRVNKHITLATVSQMSASPCWSVLSSDSLEATSPIWQTPPLFHPSKEKGKKRKGCRCTAWHKTRPACREICQCRRVGVLHLTLNYRQTFPFQVQLLWEIIGTLVRGRVSVSSITCQWCACRNWLQADNLSLQLAYNRAEAKAMAFLLNYLPFNQWHGDGENVSGRTVEGLGIHHARPRWR